MLRRIPIEQTTALLLTEQFRAGAASTDGADADHAATVGFDWQEPEGARLKLEEEIAETWNAAGDEAPERLEEEYGDLLFAAVNWGRLLGVHPHTALQRANRKFESRFRRLEALAAERGLVLEEQGLDVLDSLWEEIKAAEH